MSVSTLNQRWEGKNVIGKGLHRVSPQRTKISMRETINSVSLTDRRGTDANSELRQTKIIRHGAHAHAGSAHVTFNQDVQPCPQCQYLLRDKRARYTPRSPRLETCSVTFVQSVNARRKTGYIEQYVPIDVWRLIEIHIRSLSWGIFTAKK